ncbi:protein containing Transcription regulator LuxR [Candidatus Magnetobacterium bavaricum]|uniref:Protein containing Transcription regulator LuxR n=1 Tax=Candidatus Magnetobacterium bavaricum TaxID=29290 RepID=A0A0F3GPY2_9BACT|nr:protein containing Transcription regulator LuxR [Candidatus Magnetobacterium bavaricum]
MEDFIEIIKKRSNPGVLIFDAKNQMIFSNSQGLDLVPDIVSRQVIHARVNEPPLLIKSLYHLCDRVRKGAREEKSDTDKLDREGLDDDGNIVSCTIATDTSGQLLSLRAFSISQEEDDGSPLHIMVLIERIAEKHSVDFKKAGLDFNLSKRELEVVELVCLGNSNKEIADKLFVCEYTVKDHLKSIMRKISASNRCEIISRLAFPPPK